MPGGPPAPAPRGCDAAAAITRQEVEALLSEQRKALEACVRTEVRRHLEESFQCIKDIKVEAESMHASMKATLHRYAQEAPEAERLCWKLQEGLAQLPKKEKLIPRLLPKVFSLHRGRAQPEQQQPTFFYRNIKYSDDLHDKAGHLPVFDSPGLCTPRRASFRFGDLLPVKDSSKRGGILWLQLGKGAISGRKDLEGKWVQGELADGTVQCLQMTQAVEGKGRPEPVEYSGQSFGRFYSSGFDGRQNALLLSACRQAFWSSLQLTCLLRNIGSCPILERAWSDEEDYDQWVPHYAINVFRFAVSGGCKKMLVAVAPTANWRRYSGPIGICASDPEAVRADVGVAQHMECCWLFSMCKRLGLEWSDVTFMTALSLLRQYGKWSVQDCRAEALAQLEWARKGFETLDAEGMAEELFRQLFCVEEAFDVADLQAELGLKPKLRRSARHAPNPVRWQDADELADGKQLQRAKELLSEMATLWDDARTGGTLGALRKLGLDEEDLSDIHVLTGRKMLLHAAAACGPVQVVEPMVKKLREGGALRDCLVRPNDCGQTPLHTAAAAGQAEAAGLLAEALATEKRLHEVLLMKDHYGRTPMHWAAEQGLGFAMQLLIECAATGGHVSDLMQDTDLQVLTPLQCAESLKGSGLHMFMNSIVAAGNTMGEGVVSEWLHTATHCQKQSALILQMRDSKGRSALHWCAEIGAQGPLQALLEVAASLGCASDMLQEEDCEGSIPLLCAGRDEVLLGCFMDAVTAANVAREWLLRCDKNGQTALHRIAATGPAQAACVLLQAAVTTDTFRELLWIKDDMGRTPVHWVASSGLGDAALPLLEAAFEADLGADVLQETDKQGRTPLDCARESRAIRTFAEAAMNAGLSMELAHDLQRSCSALRVAAAHGDLPAVHALLTVMNEAGYAGAVLLANGGDFCCGGNHEVGRFLQELAVGLGLRAHRPNWNLIEIRAGQPE